MERIQGPDFPTGGLIVGRAASRTPTAPAAARSRCARSSRSRRTTAAGRCLVVTELPYQVNPDSLAAQDRRAADSGKVHRASPTCATTRPVAHRHAAGHRAQARRGRQGRAQQPLQAHPAAGHVRLQHARPGRRRAADAARSTRSSGTGSPTRSTSSAGAPRFRLREAEERAHILRGLLKALDRIDEVIALIRGQRVGRGGPRRADRAARHRRDPGRTRSSTCSCAGSRPWSARRSWTRYDELMRDDRRSTTRSSPARSASGRSSRDELAEIVDKYGDERRTQLVPYEGDMSAEDLIPERGRRRHHHPRRLRQARPTPTSTARSAAAARASAARSCARTTSSSTSSSRRPTTGSCSSPTRAGSTGPRPTSCPTPAATPAASTSPTCWPSSPTSTIAQVLDLRDYEVAPYLVLATKRGLVKKTRLTRVRLQPHRRPDRHQPARDDDGGDELISARLVVAEDDLLLVSRKAQSVRFTADRRGAAADGPGHLRRARACAFKGDDELLAMEVVAPGRHRLHGHRRRLRQAHRPSRTTGVQGRGGLGIQAMKFCEARGLPGRRAGGRRATTRSSRSRPAEGVTRVSRG